MNTIDAQTSAPTPTRSHEIAGILRDEILRGQYREGERLPSERDLAERFGTSRGAVREALSQIEQLRLISIQPGGARIKAVDEASISVLGPLLGLDKIPNARLVDQFLDTFSALTRFTATRAIPLASEEQRLELLERLHEMEGQLSEAASLQTSMRGFFLLLGRIADNLVVRLISNDLQAQFVERMLTVQSRPKSDSEALKKLITELQHGVEQGDGEAVARALDEHFLNIRSLVAQALAK